MFLFTHIEKCAGTTFTHIIELTFPRYIRVSKNNYGGNEQRNDLSLKQFKKLMNYYPSGIGGHSVRPYLEFLNLKSNTFITFFRDPFERYMSQYNHTLEGGWVSSMDDFLSHRTFNDFITNKIAGNNDFEFAVKLLNEYNFIGDVNNFNKSLNCLQDVLNIKLFGNGEHKNTRKHRDNYLKFSDLTNNQKLKVEENNKNDIKLYEKFIINSTLINKYSNELQLKSPSLLRKKCLNKLNQYKKKKIVAPIRLINE